MFHTIYSLFCLGLSVSFGGRQEPGLRAYASVAGITAKNGVGMEGGTRIGFNIYNVFKGDRWLTEQTFAWYLGAAFGSRRQVFKKTLVLEEFRFAGNSVPAEMDGGSWGIGGVAMRTSLYRGQNISGYLGTQYIKGAYKKIDFSLNHSNDAMMVGFWLKKFMPPILGFMNTDWNRTTELAATFNISDKQNTYSAFYRASLFTPEIMLDPVGTRVEYPPVITPRGRLMQYVMNPAGHRTFFSFNQVGVSASGQSKDLAYSGSIRYNYGDPRPCLQNHVAHGDGYRFPLILPFPGGPANQSLNAVNAEGNILLID